MNRIVLSGRRLVDWFDRWTRNAQHIHALYGHCSCHISSFAEYIYSHYQRSVDLICFSPALSTCLGVHPHVCARHPSAQIRRYECFQWIVEICCHFNILGCVNVISLPACRTRSGHASLWGPRLFRLCKPICQQDSTGLPTTQQISWFRQKLSNSWRYVSTYCKSYDIFPFILVRLCLLAIGFAICRQGLKNIFFAERFGQWSFSCRTPSL